MTLEDIRKFRESRKWYKPFQLEELSIEGIKKFRSKYPTYSTAIYGGSWFDNNCAFTYTNEYIKDLHWGS